MTHRLRAVSCAIFASAHGQTLDFLRAPDVRVLPMPIVIPPSTPHTPLHMIRQRKRRHTLSLNSLDLLHPGTPTPNRRLVKRSRADSDNLDGVLGARLDLEDGITGVDGAGKDVFAFDGYYVCNL